MFLSRFSGYVTLTIGNLISDVTPAMCVICKRMHLSQSLCTYVRLCSCVTLTCCL